MAKRKPREKMTTIQVSSSVRRQLATLKTHPRETFNDVVDRLIEDQQEISPAMERRLERTLREVRAGKFVTLEEIRAELGL